MLSNLARGPSAPPGAPFHGDPSDEAADGSVSVWLAVSVRLAGGASLAWPAAPAGGGAPRGEGAPSAPPSAPRGPAPEAPELIPPAAGPPPCQLGVLRHG